MELEQLRLRQGGLTLTLILTLTLTLTLTLSRWRRLARVD